MNPLMLRCECYGEMLVIDHDDGQFYLSLFKHEYGYNYTFTQRIRHIWAILTKGHPYTDSVVLSRNKALELQEWLKLETID